MVWTFWPGQRPESKKLLVLTTSREPTDIESAFELGANAYLAKPSTVSELTDMMQATKAFWLRFNQFC